MSSKVVTSPLNAPLSKVLVAMRKEAGLRQIDIWTALEWDKNRYVYMEYGSTPWDVNKLDSIAAVFGVSAWQMLKRATELLEEES